MRERRTLPVTGRRTTWTVDVVVFSSRDGSLVVLTVPIDRRGDAVALPTGVPQGDETLDRCARRLTREACGQEAAWLEQVGAFADGRKHPVQSELSVGFVAVVPPDAGREPESWLMPAELGGLEPRQRAIADSSLLALRARLDHSPIAFRLLPTRFTLTDLQRVYEMLLGHRLHKASFRRALQAAWLVEPTDSWRSEGRGRPAQLYTFAPRKRRGVARGVRFDRVN